MRITSREPLAIEACGLVKALGSIRVGGLPHTGGPLPG